MNSPAAGILENDMDPNLKAFLDVFIPYAPIGQVIAYIALTIASVTVALAQMRIAYRQNIGWPPLVLVVRTGVDYVTGSPGICAATARIEIWNRRKYPIVVRHLRVDLPTLTLELVDGWKSRGWAMASRPAHVFFDEVRVIEPNGYAEYVFNAPFKGGSKEQKHSIAVSAHMFDPRANKALVISTKQIEAAFYTGHLADSQPSEGDSQRLGASPPSGGLVSKE